jgi:MAE_28990/MAE_18760-like HEPN
MFPALRIEVADRFTAVEKFFQQACRLRGELSQTARGLAFVQIYAIHEYTVATVVEHAAGAVAAHAHKYMNLRPSLLALFLDAEIRSVQDSGPKSQWESRLTLFDRATSKKPAAFVGAPAMPADGSHFRHPQIELILRVFGIKRKLTRRKRHLFLIDEIVNYRNEIAHGNFTAAEVGRGYSNEEVRARIRQMKSVSLRLIQILEEHCSDPAKHCR